MLWKLSLPSKPSSTLHPLIYSNEYCHPSKPLRWSAADCRLFESVSHCRYVHQMAAHAMALLFGWRPEAERSDPGCICGPTINPKGCRCRTGRSSRELSKCIHQLVALAAAVAHVVVTVAVGRRSAATVSTRRIGAAIKLWRQQLSCRQQR